MTPNRPKDDDESMAFNTASAVAERLAEICQHTALLSTWCEPCERLAMEIIDCLIECHDEIETAEIILTERNKPKRSVCLSTSTQIVEWLESVLDAAGRPRTLAVPDGS